MLHSRVSAMLKFVGTFLAAFVAAFIFLSATSPSIVSATSIKPSPVVDRVAQEASTNSFNQIYLKVSPSVVSINVTVRGRNSRIIGSGTGSGFVIDSTGHIVTNDHVVNDASTIEVEFFDGTLAAGEVVGVDPSSDLAVIKVDVPTEKLVPVTFGDSDALIVGESVLALGSPFGQDWTLTTGIVSGLNRVISGMTNFSIGGVIQTDAAINPGNSGGPLLNLNGEVIGVNSQIQSESGSNSGVGFAIPGNLVKRVAQELIQDGKVDYSYMGISGTDVNLALINTLGLPASTRGVVVTEIVNDGPAAQAGLQSAALSAQANGSSISKDDNYDVITAIDGHPVKGMNDLIAFLARATVPGETVPVTVLRNGSQTLTLNVKMSPRPAA